MDSRLQDGYNAQMSGRPDDQTELRTRSEPYSSCSAISWALRDQAAALRVVGDSWFRHLPALQDEAEALLSLADRIEALAQLARS